jgi:DnaJ domain/Protein of unknown function (DUF1566)
MKDYYYTLGIEKEATEPQIKTAYRKLALQFHPDKNHGDKFFEERFKDIQEAYEVLINTQKRHEYDLKFKSPKVEEKTSAEEQEIILRYGEELRKKEEEIKIKYKTAAQKAAEEKAKIREEEEKKKNEERDKLLAESQKYKSVLRQKENTITQLKESIAAIESELPEIHKLLKQIDNLIDSLNKSVADESEEQYTRTGEMFEGGMIVYANEKGEHGLICSVEDLGKSNWAEAKIMCEAYNGGGKSNWRLPTKEELVLIYQLLYKKQGVKSFASKNYWSSSKNKSDFAWIFDFYSGDTYDYYNRYNAYFVRAVREF